MAATPIHTGTRSNAKLFFFFVKAAAVTVVAVIVASGVWQPASASLKVDLSTIGIGDRQSTASDISGSNPSSRLSGTTDASSARKGASAARSISVKDPDPVVVLAAIDESNAHTVAAAEEVGTMTPLPTAPHVLPDVSDGWSTGSASAYSIVDNDDGEGNFNTTATASGRKLDDGGITVAVPESQSWRLGQAVAVMCGDKVVVATVTDTGGFAPYGRDLDLAPGTWKALGARSVGDWGVRTVYYKFL
ncbi:hypothetical protein [Slackia exigua]|uniref:hypothetical protein n=1 Tax=Slackia exigua TaxID=84109 RepID=UPI0028D18CE0|nr:hypothetical protein [Slackia exigua]